jgi:hypothetical protein
MLSFKKEICDRGDQRKRARQKIYAHPQAIIYLDIAVSPMNSAYVWVT